MRVILFLLIVACDRPGGRPGPPPVGGIDLPDTSTGGEGEPPLRFDLGVWPALDVGGGLDLGLPQAESTGDTGFAGSTGTTSASTGEPGSTSTGEETSTGPPGSSSGEPPPLPPCPCTAEAAAAKNLCGLPPGTCPPVMPGGYCDPNGDGAFADGDWNQGWADWVALCA